MAKWKDIFDGLEEVCHGSYTADCGVLSNKQWTCTHALASTSGLGEVEIVTL